MIEIRIHGRGGQGAVIASKVLAGAAFREGKHVQAFPSFGAERRGAPVMAFARLDDEPIRLRSQIYEPDHLIVLDASLLEVANVTAGLKPGGWVLVNSADPPDALHLPGPYRLATVDASAIARQYRLGPVSAPIVNTAILGAFARLTGLVGLETLAEAVREAVPVHPDENVAATREAFERVRVRDAVGTEPAPPPPRRKLPRAADMPPVAFSQGPTLPIKTGSWRYLRPFHEERLSPCNLRCPAGENIVGYLRLLGDGDYHRGWERIRQDNPFPGVCGRVCPHPCEDECNRTDWGGPLAVHLAERFLADWAASNLQSSISNPQTEIAPEAKTVAIVGSGPAGLSCAYHLARRGHRVTVYEAAPLPGGMMRLGIPDYRLPRKVLNREIMAIQSLGVEVHCNSPIGDGKSVDDLLAAHDAVFLAVGMQKTHPLGIAGEDAKEVISGLDFLRRLNLDEKVKIGKRVVVVGGGNTAMDAARSALRLGSRVTVLYRRGRAEMPAIAAEVAEALDEGVDIRYLAAPTRVLVKGKRVTGLECVQMRLGEPDESGRRRPIPIGGSEFTLEADTVIAAVGQRAELDFLPPGVAVRHGQIVADGWGATGRPGLFAGGDVTTGDGTVSHAIGSGKRAALAIDRYLRGETLAAPVAAERPVVRAGDLNVAYFAAAARVAEPQTAVEARVGDFGEVNQGLPAEAAVAEARRCLSCGTCNLCGNCYIFCPDLAVRLAARGDAYEVNYDYCKGCGICVVECPREALSFEEEVKWRK